MQRMRLQDGNSSISLGLLSMLNHAITCLCMCMSLCVCVCVCVCVCACVRFLTSKQANASERKFHFLYFLFL